MASWPLRFVILAVCDGRIFMVSETLAIVVFVFSVWLGLRYFGLQATGIGFLIMYVAYLPLVYSLVRIKTVFRWARNVLLNAVLLLMVSVLVTIAAAVHSWAGAVLGILAATLFGLFSLQRLAFYTTLSIFLSRLIKIYQKLILKVGIRCD